jgi:hypothetical protein
VTDDQTKALQFIAAAINDFAHTLPVSARASFIRDAQAAIKALEAEPVKAE